MRDRLEEWQALLTHAAHREAIDGGVRVAFDDAVPLDEVVRLTIAEQSCCRFFGFAITVDGRGIAMEVRAPAEALPIVESLFGVPA
jgi:hypothetical protein